MKRFLLILSLLLLAALPALADNRVFDDADLLSAGEETSLNDTIARIYSTYHFDVVLHTTPSTHGKSVRMYAADYYDDGGFGYGEDGDGLIFVISMAERDYYTVTTGSGIRIFTDYGIDKLGEDIVPYLSDGDYAGAMTRYLADVERFIAQATGGADENTDADTRTIYDYTPYDYDTPVTLRAPGERLAAAAPVILAAALVIALIVVLIMRAGMKTARRQAGAGDYVVRGSLNLTRREDIFLYTTTVRTKIESNNGGGRGGSSTFRGSGGRSHGGGGGKF